MSSPGRMVSVHSSQGSLKYACFSRGWEIVYFVETPHVLNSVRPCRLKMERGDDPQRRGLLVLWGQREGLREVPGVGRGWQAEGTGVQCRCLLSASWGPPECFEKWSLWGLENTLEVSYKEDCWYRNLCGEERNGNKYLNGLTLKGVNMLFWNTLRPSFCFYSDLSAPHPRSQLLRHDCPSKSPSEACCQGCCTGAAWSVNKQRVCLYTWTSPGCCPARGLGRWLRRKHCDSPLSM